MSTMGFAITNLKAEIVRLKADEKVARDLARDNQKKADIYEASANDNLVQAESLAQQIKAFEDAINLLKVVP